MSQSVFVCYARADEAFVLSFANQLRARGIDIWLDQWAILRGADWDLAIDDALSRCACFLVILSPNSVSSDEVRGELRTALDLGKTIVPVLFRPCNIPRRLRLKQYVDLSARQWDAPDSVELVVSALHDAMSAPDRSNRVDPADAEDLTRYAASRPGLITGLLRRSSALDSAAHESAQTPVGKLRLWGREHPSYLLALGLPPLAFATWHLFRLPVPAEGLPNLVFVATAVLCLLALWLGSRLGAILLAAGIGGAFVLKPLLVPFEGFADGAGYPYMSETAMTYWLPGGAFLVLATALVLTLTRSRLTQDLGRLRPRAGAIVIAAAMALAAYLHFSSPTVYDVYLPFRARYGLFRERLRTIAAALDAVKAPFLLPRQLDVPLVLDESSRVREYYPSTTGHILLYQHLSDPDSYFGDIEYAFDNDDLHLNVRDTGFDPVLYAPGFARFASGGEARSLEQAINAPYLVVVKPLSLDHTGRVDTADLPRAGPYRVFLYDLKRDEVICAIDVETPVRTTDELKEAVYLALQRSVGAKILR